ncbi:IMP cyclohydrolase [Fervidobacterium thailandense]|uniref:IMP cyclohydrolase n=1 Tax=Fervidobacterium thailandense TaxID=1008305 RepID=A0A1E3G3U1_9BACT|nr:IMP cyclohydrolase [Fervidobacterium thailandense]ODN30830.1 IMP cyclohydrolase [Fervidobacterium thailandense]
MNIKRALISVSDKTGLVEFAKALHERGVEILSTGGTAKTLSEAGIPVRQVSDVTGFPEILGGRVKTLHPKIFGGILADTQDPSHVKDLRENAIEMIDMVVVNLYPFDLVQRQTRDEDVLIENIDIGGVALLRAAAKNHRNVVVVCDPADYKKILNSIDACGDVPLHDRRMLALKAFYHTMRYDATIHRVLSELFASEKYEHLTFERFAHPQKNYEILDSVDERIFKLSNYDENTIGVLIGAILTTIEENLIVGLNSETVVSMVNIRESGGRLCDISGNVVVLRRLNGEMARKLREGTFSTIACEVLEDEDLVLEILKGKKIVRYERVCGKDFEKVEFLTKARQVANLVLRKKVVLKSDSKERIILSTALEFLPTFAVVGKAEDGFYHVELDPSNPTNALKKLLISVPKRFTLVATNGEPDGMFMKTCEENRISVVG